MHFVVKVTLNRYEHYLRYNTVLCTTLLLLLLLLLQLLLLLVLLVLVILLLMNYGKTKMRTISRKGIFTCYAGHYDYFYSILSLPIDCRDKTEGE